MTFYEIDILIIDVLIVWFVLAMFKPNLFAGFLPGNSRLRILIIFLTMLPPFLAGAFFLDTFETKKTQFDNRTKTEQRAPSIKPDKLPDEVKDVLDKTPTAPTKGKEVKHFQSWGTSTVPEKEGVFWELKMVKSNPYIRIVIVQSMPFSQSWIDPKTVIFSTDQGSWTYTIDERADSFPDWTTLDLIDTAKLEILFSYYEKVKPGIDILISGSNPRITLKGDSEEHTIKLSSYTIAELKTVTEMNKTFEDIRKVKN